MSEKPANPRFGSSFDDWLKEQGIYEEVTTHAIERVLAWQGEAYRAMAADKEREAEAAEWVENLTGDIADHPPG
jgi:hypothetical protein